MSDWFIDFSAWRTVLKSSLSFVISCEIFRLDVLVSQRRSCGLLGSMMFFKISLTLWFMLPLGLDLAEIAADDMFLLGVSSELIPLQFLWWLFGPINIKIM